jgi:hypothetical protein
MSYFTHVQVCIVRMNWKCVFCKSQLSPRHPRKVGHGQGLSLSLSFSISLPCCFSCSFFQPFSHFSLSRVCVIIGNCLLEFFIWNIPWSHWEVILPIAGHTNNRGSRGHIWVTVGGCLVWVID